MFHNNCFGKFKITVFTSTVVFKFQIKAKSKGIQHQLLSSAVQLAKLWLSISCFYSQSLVLSNLVINDCKLSQLRMYHKLFCFLFNQGFIANGFNNKKVVVGHISIHFIFSLVYFS